MELNQTAFVFAAYAVALGSIFAFFMLSLSKHRELKRQVAKAKLSKENRI